MKSKINTVAHGGKLKDQITKLSNKKARLTGKILSLPKINLNSRQLCDLELIINGGFSPLEGFLNKLDYVSVLEKMRLKNKILWPIPITLDVDDVHRFKSKKQCLLCDQYGKPLAILKIESIFKPNKTKEADLVYKTNDQDHFGVNYLFNNTKKYYLGGQVTALNTVDRLDFNEFRLSPFQLRKFFKLKGWDKIIGFQTRNPLHQIHYALIKQAAKTHQAKVLIHPAVGLTKEDDIDYLTRIRCYITLHQKYTKGFSQLALLPLAMRMAGPREALWHAIIRKNYGCTHFIVGRDHAGPGKNSQNQPFYQPYEAQELVEKHSGEIGIQIVPFKEMVWSVSKKTYLTIDKITSGQKIKRISGSEFRTRLKTGRRIPGWFSFPEIIDELKKGIEKERKDGLTIFFTGLPCAGKSTIAKMLYFKILEIQDKKVTLLDGDIVRQNLSKGLGFSEEDRNINIKRIGFVANQITKHRGIVICSAIAPYKESRNYNRSLISSNGNYVEIYVSTPVKVCEQRDIKGLYKKARLGMITGLTGVDDPYQVPDNPEIIIKTTNSRPTKNVDKIIKYLKQKNLIKIS